MEENDRVLARVVDLFLLLWISLNVFVVLLESVAELNEEYGMFFQQFEIVSVVIFSLEYVLRLWVCTERAEFAEGAVGRVRYAFTSMALIDLAVILPFYLPLLFPFDARILRLIRLVRLMRLLKVIRYSESLRVFYRRLPDEEERTWNGLPRDSLFAGDGFGSYLPDYTARQIFGAIIALLGIGLFALPAGILGSGFVGALRRKSSGRFYCPHCSEEITRK